MEEPTIKRWITYAIVTIVYMYLHTVVNSVANDLVKNIADNSTSNTNTITARKDGQDMDNQRHCDGASKKMSMCQEQNERGKKKMTFGISKNVFITLTNVINAITEGAMTTVGMRSGKDGDDGDKDRIMESGEKKEQEEREIETQNVHFCAEILRAFLCIVLLIWSQYFVGPNSPAWLWGLMNHISFATESSRGKHAIFFTIQAVAMTTLITIGGTMYCATTSAICMFCTYIMQLRLLEYAQEQTYTEQTVREYEKVAQLKTKLLSHISHELRSPLTSIIMVTELAMTIDCSEEFKKENCQVIVHSANVLLSMINDILEFGKLEEKKAHLHIKQIDPRKTMSELWTVMRKAMEFDTERKIECVMNITDNVPDKIGCDGIKLQQICQNIIGNAIKFTDQGKVTAELDVLTPSALIQRFIEDRKQYTSCFLPIPAEGSIIHEMDFLESFGTPCQSKLTYSQSKKTGSYSSGFILPEISNNIQERLEIAKQRPMADDRKLLVLSVSDTGIGIEAKTFKRLFNPFTQADDSITRSYGGTGLGLSISRELTDLMKGFILTYSTFGRGSKFCIVLPLADINTLAEHNKERIMTTLPSSSSTTMSDTDSPSSPTTTANNLVAAYRRTVSKNSNDGGGISPKSRVECSPNEKRMFGNLKCLIADDQLMNRKVLRHALAQIGCSEDLIEFVRDGREAMELFHKKHKEEQPFDLCLLDIMMPHVDGFQACSMIREYEAQEKSKKTCKILMVSADVTRIEDAKDYGADSFVSKPFTTRLIQEKLIEILGLMSDDGNE